MVNRILRSIVLFELSMLAVAHCYPLGSGWH